jgi:CheY-like chemotaxis protein
MVKEPPLIIIEDDEEDQEVITEILKNLQVKNELKIFSRCEDALQFLQSTKRDPFLVICDINIPGMKGVELKRVLDGDENLKMKCIPFIFLSTAAEKEIVNEAYSNLSIQGFFQKPTKYNELKRVLETVLEYWQLSKRPTS